MNNNIGEKYLPIGTIVMLKGAQRKLMITGFCAADMKDKSVAYDYSGCLYPYGFISSDKVALFNHDQIQTIYHKGFSDDEDKQFKHGLNEFVKNLNIGINLANLSNKNQQS